MAGGSSDNDDGPIAGINVTPLVDVTLVLLIIFMVTARIIVSQGMPMDLPKAASGEALQQVFSVELCPATKQSLPWPKPPRQRPPICAPSFARIAKSSTVV